MCLCDSHRSEKNKKGDEDMNTTVDINIEPIDERKVRISSEAVENLMNKKSIIKCKDGVAQIDKDHPDYNFWMED